MPLCSIQGRDFRRFRRFELVCNPHTNWLVGPNGSGKTSILEGIYLLARGKSFRTTRRQVLQRQGSSGFTIKAKVTDPLRGYTHLTANTGADGIRYTIQGEAVRNMSTLAELVPVQLMDPQLTPLVAGTPRDRRRFLDWGLFHVDPSFHPHWRDYSRALEQRNSALRMGAADDVLSGWERLLAREGEIISALRNALLADICSSLYQRAIDLSGPDDTVLRYQAGSPAGQSLEEALRRSRARDRHLGITSVGPHRADIDIRIGGQPAHQILSRGEEKRLTYALLLAQVDVFHRRTGGYPILLLDDPIAELDRQSWRRLMSILESLPAQQFVTAFEDSMPQRKSISVFHVEQLDAMGMV
ncbi:MAG TPA: DNA replication and repair protein RecF [Candidatus Acidoferrales bacterium]|nr:DNA replication and repair protein RecF [Candidatus Acidoferrales bacterium]